jgi:hypothetical protein
MSILLRSRSDRRRRPAVPSLESLEARTVLSAITVMSLTETSAQQLKISYEVTPTDLSTVTVNLYRSATSSLNVAMAEPIGSAMLSGATGVHANVPITLAEPLSGGALPLSPDPSHPYVFASIVGPDGETSSASFQKIVVGVVTHGYNIPGETTLPVWVTEMATAMKAEGYQYVIPFDWVYQSELLEPNQATDAGKRVAGLVETYLATPGNVPAGAVVDLHFIGHSRGTVVVNQAFTTLQADLPTDSPARNGYWRETLLDPHPAHGLNQAPFSITSGRTGQVALAAGNLVQTSDQDPLPIIVPSQVTETQVYHQHSPTSYAPYLSPEAIISPNGLAPGDGVNLTPGASTIISGLDLTTPGIVHSGVWAWYLANVIPRLGSATGFVNGPVDAPIEASAYDRSAYTDFPFLPLVGSVQTMNPNSVAGDLTASIDWGDGSVPSQGTVLGTALTGFAITSDHEYAKAGTYTTTITVKDVGGSVSVAHGTITVSDFTYTTSGSAPGSPPLVTVRNDQTGEVVRSFAPYDSRVVGGVEVATADVNGDGVPEIITSAGPGGSPQPVKVFDGRDLHLISSLSPFGRQYRGRLSVTAGDMDADGYAEIIVGRGALAKVYDGSTLALVDTVRIPTCRTRTAYDLSGVDADGDGFADIVVHRRNGSIRVVDGHTLIHRRALRVLAQFHRGLATYHLQRARR